MRLTMALLLVVLAGCQGTKSQAKDDSRTHTLHETNFKVQIVAESLQIPWSMATLPSGQMLLTERPGRLSLLEPNGKLRLIEQINEVDSGGERGLMGVAISPNFGRDGWIFLSYTARKTGKLQNCIVRYNFDGRHLSQKKVLVDSLPAADYHDGLPLGFGPDGKLYASTGDAGHGQYAQQIDSLAGKFLRINPDGSVPADNPFAGSLVWSLGHRNCQGFDWHPASSRLYATEHGPSVPVDSLVGGGDELNLIQKGGNYGWPVYHHEKNAAGFIAPLMTWTPAIAPSGACFYRGDKFPKWRNRFFFCALRGEALYCVTFSIVDPTKVDHIVAVLNKDYGRLRAVHVGLDGYLYVTTSNSNGLGLSANKDRLLRLVPVD